MEKKNRKYNDIIRAATALFFKYGLRRVTVEDVCREAPVSKMTFYKHFPNKIELIKAVLDRTFRYRMHEYHEVMDAPIPFPEKMHRFLIIKVEGAKDASLELMRDLYGGDIPELKDYVDGWIQHTLRESINLFVHAQEQGWMRKDLKPELMLAVVNQSIELMRDEKLLQCYDSVQDLSHEVTKFFLYGVMDER